MKKIFNWTFGSFFRTIGRFLFYLLLALLITYFLDINNIKIIGLFDVLNVSADTTDDWIWNIENLSTANYNYVNHTSNGVSWLTNRMVSWNIPRNDTINNDVIIKEINTPSHDSTITIANNGVSLTYFTANSLKQGYLYNINSYFCSNNNIYNTIGHLYIGYSASNSLNNDMTYTYTNVTQLGQVPGVTYDLRNCVMYSSLVVPSANGSWVDIKLTASSSITNTNLYFIGYDIQELGIYTDTVRNIIQNSGFASATSVAQVQSSITQMQTDIQDQTQQQQENHEETINTITSDDSSGATTNASNFFNNFTTDTHGLTGIITSPLNAINSLTSSSCSPLVLPLPFVNQNLTLPCMRPIYDQHFGLFMQIYDVITLGIISYWVMVRIFSLVKDFKNPEHDEVEVLDL